MKLYDFLAHCRELLVLLESLEDRHNVIVAEIGAAATIATDDPDRAAILGRLDAEHRAASGELNRAVRLLGDFHGITVCS